MSVPQNSAATASSAATGDGATATGDGSAATAATPPHRSLLSPFNIVAGVIVLVGLVLTWQRFTGGLGAVSNIDDTNPWGIWIGFDLLTGVALAAGGYTTAAAVYLFGLKQYHAAVRPAVLTGFLGYALVVFALLYDVGQPWRLPYPFVVSQGTTSVMFEVGACVALYLTVLFLEFLPVPLEWLKLRRARDRNYTLIRYTALLTVLGIVLNRLNVSLICFNWYLPANERYVPMWKEIALSVFIVTVGILVYRFIVSRMPILREHPDFRGEH